MIDNFVIYRILRTYVFGLEFRRLELALQPRGFIVGTPQRGLPFVGGSRKGELEGIYMDDIVKVFGPPTWDHSSGDGKTQVEWDIEFDNGVRLL